VEKFGPQKVIIFGWQARGDARWDSDADILVVMPYEGRPFAMRREIRRARKPSFRIDLVLWRPKEIEPRFRWGDPIIREGLDHGEVIHG
jgi:predicted nucleotidyltransferase